MLSKNLLSYNLLIYIMEKVFKQIKKINKFNNFLLTK